MRRIARAVGAPRRLAMLSVHTSPLDQPGTGDAGGMNVYVLELARRLATSGVDVEIFTRATSSRLDPVVEAAPGVLVRHVPAGPFEGLTKDELPAQMCTLAREVLRLEALHAPGRYDLVHSHYWLSGQVGALVSDRWGVPLVHSMHTMAKVKNAFLAEGDAAEPPARILGEEQVVEASDRLIANTAEEADQLVDLYAADAHRVEVVHPGVDLSIFSPGRTSAARSRLGLPDDAVVLLFAGRIQPLKAPDVLVRAAAELVARDPALASRLVVAVVGGPSGSGLERPQALVDLAAELGIRHRVRFVPPVDQTTLADWYTAASVVCVPSYSESFGLVALEAAACGTPVVAARVGGLSTVVADGRTGLLVDGHGSDDWARAIGTLVHHPALLDRMGTAAADHAESFSWAATADRTLGVYAAAVTDTWAAARAVS